MFTFQSSPYVTINESLLYFTSVVIIPIFIFSYYIYREQFALYLREFSHKRIFYLFFFALIGELLINITDFLAIHHLDQFALLHQYLYTLLYSLFFFEVIRRAIRMNFVFLIIIYLIPFLTLFLRNYELTIDLVIFYYSIVSMIFLVFAHNFIIKLKFRKYYPLYLLIIGLLLSNISNLLIFDFVEYNTYYLSNYYIINKFSRIGFFLIINSLLVYQIKLRDLKHAQVIAMRNLRWKLVLTLVSINLLLLLLSSIIVYYAETEIWQAEKNKLSAFGFFSQLFTDQGDLALLESFNKPQAIQDKNLVEKLRNRIAIIENALPEINSIHLMEYERGKYIHLIDTVKTDNGILLQSAEETQKIANDLIAVYKEGKQRLSEGFVTDQWGSWFTVYAPIKKEAGKVVAILVMDKKADLIITELYHARLQIYLVFFLIIFLSYFILIFYYDSQLAKIRFRWQNQILRKIDNFILLIDNQGKIKDANKAFLDSMEKKLIEVEERKIEEYFSLPNISPSWEELLTKQLPENGGSLSLELTIREDVLSRKEEKRYYQVSFEQFIETETAHLIVVSASDITELKRNEKIQNEHLFNILELLTKTIDAKDNYTAMHSQNVSYYAGLIAQYLGLPDEKIKEIKSGGLIHDLGKIGVPDSILNKNGFLSKDEWEIIKQHPVFGKKILETAGAEFQSLIPYIYYHHERIDGEGYPTGMKDVPLEIGIITAADSLDAMLSDRVYRKGLSIEKVKSEFQNNSGKQFHPEVAKAVLDLIEQGKIIKLYETIELSGAKNDQMTSMLKDL